MVESTLKSQFPDIEIVTVKENAAHNFTLKHAKSRDLGYQLLFTEGLANFNQPIKEGFEAYQNIELYFCLPDYWNLDKESWPIKWLSRVAQVPQKNSTWFGPGDTIPAGSPPEVLSDRFPANHFMLCDPIKAAFFEDSPWKESGISFLGLVPIAQQELDYKLRNSATVLLQRLEKKGHTEQVDLFRSSVCRKRILGF